MSSTRPSPPPKSNGVLVPGVWIFCQLTMILTFVVERRLKRIQMRHAVVTQSAWIRAMTSSVTQMLFRYVVVQLAQWHRVIFFSLPSFYRLVASNYLVVCSKRRPLDPRMKSLGAEESYLFGFMKKSLETVASRSWGFRKKTVLINCLANEYGPNSESGGFVSSVGLTRKRKSRTNREAAEEIFFINLVPFPLWPHYSLVTYHKTVDFANT